MAKRVTDGWTMYEPETHTTMANRLSGILEGYTEDCRRFASAAREAKFTELHAKFNLSWKEFCVERLRTDPDVVDAIILGVEVLGEDMPIPAEWAERVGRIAKQKEISRKNQAADAVPVKKQGRPKKVDNNKNDVNLFCKSGDGNNPSYAMRRLFKWRPDLHAKCLAGELTTNAAMVQAGYRKKPAPRKKPVLTRIQYLWHQADVDERDRIIQWVLAQIAEGTPNG